MAKIKTAPDQGQCSMPTNSGTLHFAIVVYIFSITFCAYGTRHGEVQDMEYLSGGKDTGRGIIVSPPLALQYLALNIS
jgi:hypothetical protein